MKLAIVTSFPEDPDRPHGGVQAVSVNLTRALAAIDGLDVHVVTTDRGWSSGGEEDWAGATIHRLPWAGGKTLTHAIGPGRRQISGLVRELAPDVVHAHDTFGMMVRGLDIPRVFTIHGFIHGDTLVSGRRFARAWSRLWRHYETRGWADQPHIISISPYVRERLAGIATGVIHDIDNPIAEEFFGIERRERPRTIFCAAHINPRKNTLRLVEALAELHRRDIDAELRLAGRVIDESYGRRVAECVERHNLGSRVRMLGVLDARQIRRELSSAAVFALVSLEENSPMGIEEAMAARVPVVTSNRCGMPYMVRDGESGHLVDPNSPADIADRLADVLADDARRAQMGDAGRRIAEDRFHPAVVARRTYQVYLRAAGDKSGKGAPNE